MGGPPGQQQQPPPKPQRTFAASPATGGLIMIQGLAPRPAAMAPNSATSLAYHQNRPLPDRPYSVAGHYPTIDRATGARLPTATATGAMNTGDFSGYLSSPEHRPSAAMVALHGGQPRAPFSAYQPPTGRPYENEVVAGAAAPGAIYTHSAIYGARPANPPMDQEARIRMQEMERQIASLTNVVSKALSGKYLTVLSIGFLILALFQTLNHSHHRSPPH